MASSTVKSPNNVFAEYFNRFDGKVSPKHNNVKVFKNFYKAER